MSPDQSPQPPLASTASAAKDALRILLWSPAGSGEGRYGGVRTYSARLYAAAPPEAARITLAHGAADQPAWPRYERQHHVAPLMPAPTLFRRIRFAQRGAAWVKAHAREFDVFHGMTAFQFTIGPALAARRQGLPTAIFIANSGPEIKPVGTLHRLLGTARKRAAALRSMDAVVSMSREIEDELRSLGVRDEAIVRIPNQCNVHRFRPSAGHEETAEARRALGWPERWTATMVGELVPRKRPHLVVEAVAELVRRGIDAQAVLVGPFNDAAYGERLRAMAEEPALRGRVLFETDNRTIDVVYRGSDAFCLPSLNEGMPASLIEASASGLPSLATRFSSAAECIVDGASGHVLDEGDDLAHRIAEHFRLYHDDRALAARHGARGRAHIVERFSAEATWAAHERLFRRLAAGR